jgi:hypothetical protein
MARRYRVWWGISAGIVLGLLLLPLSVTAGQSRTFPETGQTSSNAFYDFWQAHGGLEIIGLPLSPTYITENKRVIQIYERAIMEWHPENDRTNRVQLERLGDTALSFVVSSTNQKVGDAHRTEPARPCTGGSNCETFSATSHTVLGAFRDYWYAHGGLATFGYPLTEEFSLGTFDGGGKSFVVQYFERNRFEFHPEINGGAILLGRLGVPFWEDVKTTFMGRANVTVPDYDSNAPYLDESAAPVAPPATGGQPAPSASGGGSVSITTVQGNVPGGTAVVAAQTAPNASCSIAYVNPSGIPTRTAGLEDKTANGNGAVSWSWQLDAGTPGGNGLVTVTCGGTSANGQIKIG